MKVFLSWSGEQSHKVAIIFRDWFPSVIQSIEPYVSSEDIDKGARWSTDIAKELEDSTYGILCVTQENLNAPWLNFEAGALSKTMEKSFVSPFLFNIKRSEVLGPILQFQSTIFDKEDIKKLLLSLNKACADQKLPDERVHKAFEVWYPTLESQLNALLTKPTVKSEANEQNVKKPSQNEILEEVLELSRINQKLLRNPDSRTNKQVEDISIKIDKLIDKIELEKNRTLPKSNRRLHPMFIEEMLHLSNNFGDELIGFQISLSFFKQDFPWIYDSGNELIKIIRDKNSRDKKFEALQAFSDLIDFTFQHPLMRDLYMPDKEMYIMGRELPLLLRRKLEDFLK